MNASRTTLFPMCPLCHQSSVTAVSRRIYRCGACGAEFTAAGDDRYELLRCEPSRTANKQASCACRERVLNYCLLGRSLPKAEWEQLAQGQETPVYSDYEERKRLLQSGVLSEQPQETALVPLQAGEVVYYVSCPVYTEDVQTGAGRQPVGAGNLMLTNRRLIYQQGQYILEIPLREVTNVEMAPPGFVVITDESPVYHYFYPPALDPVFDAIKAAIDKAEK